MMDKIPDKNADILLLGDFNFNLAVKNNWTTVTSMLGLSQLIQNYTRVTKKTKTLIDHIYTNNTNKIKKPMITQSSISDHYAIFCTYISKLPKLTNKGHEYIRYRSFKKFNEMYFLNDIASMSFKDIYDSLDPNKSLDLLQMMLRTATDKHAPLRTKPVKHRDIPPWMTSDIIHCMSLRDSYKKDKEEEKYKAMKNKVSKMVNAAKTTYFDSLIENKKDTATLWRALNAFTNKSHKKPKLSTSISPEEFNQHFLSVVDRTLSSDQIKASKDFTCHENLINFCKEKEDEVIFSIPFLTVYEVGKLITDLGIKKSMGPENIPAYILQLALPYIVEPLTFIYNLCISKNIFPAALKIAKVIPLPKTNDRSDPNNFRPISLLPLLSKPLERHIQKHLYQYLNTRSLLHLHQSGFRPRHSCQTTLINLCDSWLSSINKSEMVGALFLDFRKAFDLVNHTILLKKLLLYLPNSPTIHFFQSFLENRYQFVYLNKSNSKKGAITAGIPQGSVIGPLLFLIYINDMPLHLNNDLTNTLFADDASLHTSSNNINNINLNLQNGLNNVNEWCINNNMSIHPDKTKSMVITTRQKHQREPLLLTLSLGTTKIEQVNKHKVLGLTLDSELCWRAHTESLCKRLSKNVHLLSRLNKFASKPALKLFFEAQINSLINYASTLWDNCAGEYLKKINSMHRRAVKNIIPNKGISTDAKFVSLNILPLSKHLMYNKAIVVHKIIHDKAPPYLTPLLKKASTRYGSTNLILPLPRIDICKSSLAYSGSLIWNTLPDDIKNINSISKFKKHLRRHLFDVH